MKKQDIEMRLQCLDDDQREILDLTLSGKTEEQIAEFKQSVAGFSLDSIKNKIQELYRYFDVDKDDSGRKRQKFFLISLFFRYKTDMVQTKVFEYQRQREQMYPMELERKINELQEKEDNRYEILKLFLENKSAAEISKTFGLEENNVREKLRNLCTYFVLQKKESNYLIVLFFRYQPAMIKIPPLSDMITPVTHSQVEAKEVIQLNNIQVNLKTERDILTNKTQWLLIIQGDEYSETWLQEIENFVRTLTQDGTQTVIKISRGSIILEFEGSPEGFERIKALFDSGELTEIAGFAIQEISALPEQQTQRTQLSQWLQGVFAPLWESVDGLFATEQPSFAFRQRSEGISRRKTIVLNELEDLQVELVVTIIPVERPIVEVIVAILPSPGLSHVPEDLRIKLLDESDADTPEGQVFDAKENLKFNLEVGDAFSIIVEQGRYRVVERFMV